MIGILLGRALSENIMGEELNGETHPVRVDHDDKDVDINDILGMGEMIADNAEYELQKKNIEMGM